MLKERETLRSRKMGLDEKYGKRRQITFRIGPLCQDRLSKAACLFNLKPCEYVKALLYKDLGIFDEPTDRRRRNCKKRQRKSEEPDDFDERDEQI
jgi:hypothetical protein